MENYVNSCKLKPRPSIYTRFEPAILTIRRRDGGGVIDTGGGMFANDIQFIAGNNNRLCGKTWNTQTGQQRGKIISVKITLSTPPLGKSLLLNTIRGFPVNFRFIAVPL